MALRGPSGSGKSTLLAALAGLLGPDAVVGGLVAGVPAGAVAYVPQFPRTTGATVADELRRHAGSEPGMDAVIGEAFVVEALARVGATALAGRTPESLSPGELQRVALARALVRIRRGARLLLLDEPTAHLDDDARSLVADVLHGLRGTVTMLLVTHDPALAVLADRTIDLPVPTPPPPSAPRAVPPTTASDTGSVEEVTTSARVRGALAKAVLAGSLSSGAGVALTAVSGWLIVRAAQMPPVLTLLVAIVAVRFFGLGRALLRWAERMTAHDAALRLAAATRVRLWTALARQGLAADRTPGSALARVVGDVGVVQDLTVRVRPPMLVAAWVTAGTVGALALIDPVAAAAVGLVLAATVGAVLLVHRQVDAGAARLESGQRVAALRETTTLLEGIPDLRAHGLADRAAGDLDAVADRQARSARTGARAAALSVGLVALGTGLGAVLATAVGSGRGLPGPALAVLALAPLALSEPLTGLVTALQRRGALADAQGRLDAVRRAPLPAGPRGAAPGADPGDRGGGRRPHRRVAGRPRRAARPERTYRARRRLAGRAWAVRCRQVDAARRPDGLPATPRRELRTERCSGPGHRRR